MKIGQDSVVFIAYTLTNGGGEVIDASEDDGEFPYLHGYENIVPGLEEALLGKSQGDNVKAVIKPEKGYGIRNEELVFKMPRNKMPDEELELGMQFSAQDKEGEQQVVTIVKLEDEEVTLDGNHPLAGETLHFDVTIKEVRAATSEELAHGHVHGAHDHHH